MNAGGEIVAQHVVLPLHIGAFPACCAPVLRAYHDDIAEGDAFVIAPGFRGTWESVGRVTKAYAILEP